MYFLETVAEKLWDNFNQELSYKTLVFPNKRSGLYFLSYLKDIVKENFVTPKIITINELFEENTDSGVLADNLTLCIKLHESFSRHVKPRQSFVEFYDLGKTLLADFDTLDKNLVKTEKLFQDIEALKEIEFDLSYLSEEQIKSIKRFWRSFDTKNLSEQQKSFVQLWKKLYHVYTDFNLLLEEDKITYEGKIFRTLAETPSTKLLNASYIFIGLNALGKAEEKVLSHLQQQKKALFLWDYDKYFTENTENEAGYFMRRLLPKYPPFIKDLEVDNRLNTSKKIKHISCNGEIQQVKLLGQILADELKDGRNLEDTAIVLANEELLLPVLESIPAEVSKINASIGYPFKATIWAHLLSELILLQKTKVKKDEKYYYPTSNVLEILKNPYCHILDKKEAERFSTFIIENNLNTIEQPILNRKFSDLFKPMDNIDDFSSYLENILAQLLPLAKDNHIEQYVINESFHQLKHLTEIFKLRGFSELFFFCEILKDNLEKMHIPFANQSVGGLQVIGFLETRLIDFKRVYILSANEDYLPGIQHSGSLIPYSLRIGYGLPTFSEQAAMYAYYFYRLAGRADELTLFSIQGAQGVKVKEPSRYITQLKYESPFLIESFSANTLLAPIHPKKINIVDKNKIKKAFDDFISKKRKLSPSAINTYIRCPQKFYYKYIEGMNTIQEIAKADDSNIFGSIFHKAAELLYKPYIGKEITSDLLCKITDNIDNVLLEAFKIELFANTEQKLKGKELLIFDILKQYLLNLIKHDKQQVPFTILELEKKCESIIKVEIEGKEQELLLHGIIDRVDKKNNQLRLIDYKTGDATPTFEDIESLFSIGGRKDNGIVRQMFFYSWLYYTKHNQVGMPCIYSIRKFSNSKVTTNLSIKEGKSHIPFENNIATIKHYEELLSNLLAQIFTKTNRFPLNDELCTHDKYTGICTDFS